MSASSSGGHGENGLPLVAQNTQSFHRETMPRLFLNAACCQLNACAICGDSAESVCGAFIHDSAQTPRARRKRALLRPQVTVPGEPARWENSGGHWEENTRQALQTCTPCCLLCQGGVKIRCPSHRLQCSISMQNPRRLREPV